MGCSEDPKRIARLLRSLAQSAEELHDAASHPILVVQGAIDIRFRAEDLLSSAVDEARRTGCTWQQIGDLMGISRQGAFQRFGHPLDPRTGQPMDKTTLPGAKARALDLFELITTSQFEAAGGDRPIDDDLEEPFISDDEKPKTAADFVRDSQPTSDTVVQPMTKGSGGSAVSGEGWTGRSSE